MQQPRRLAAIVGIATGVFVIAGSVVGGIALAANHPGVSTVRVGDETDQTPGATPSVNGAHDADGEHTDSDENGEAADDDDAARPHPTACATPSATPEPMTSDESHEHEGFWCGRGGHDGGEDGGHD